MSKQPEIFACLVIVIPTLILYIFCKIIGLAPLTSISIAMGISLVLLGYLHLVYIIPLMSKDVDARISMEALKASFWLVIMGLIIIILGLLYSMRLLPLSA